MSVLTELGAMARRLAEQHSVPRIREAYFPPLFAGGQPVDHEFLVVALEGGAAGLSFVLPPRDSAEAYRALDPGMFAATTPQEHLAGLGGADPLRNMLGLAAVNAICQHVMRSGKIALDRATDSLGLLDLHEGDRLGMVGLFPPLLKRVAQARCELIVVEKDPAALERHPRLPITLDVAALRRCNKVLCTSTAVLNDTIDEVLANCAEAEHVSVIGPTAGFFPDPLFARGVDVVGGRYVVDGDKLLSRIRNREPWGDATEKLCFRKATYV